MPRPPALAPLFLSCLIGIQVHAGGQRFGRIRIEVPGNWTLKLLDRVEEDNATYQFPFYENDRPGSLAQHFERARLIKNPEGSFNIWPADGTDVKRLGKTGEDYDLKGRTEYLVAFDYGTLGLKTFNHVFYLYGKDQSACLLKVEAGTTDRGSTLKVKLLAQADYDDSINKFKARKQDVYAYQVDGTLAKADDSAGSSRLFIAVKKRIGANR